MKPNHIGIIMDGNRRFAKSLKLSPWRGHEFGEKKIYALLDWCKDLQIKEVTVYTFSLQNLNRPKQELDYLMGLFSKGLTKMMGDPKLSDVRVKILGEIEHFPKEIQEKIQKITEITKNNTAYYLNLAMGYGGREEIVMAIKKIAKQVKENKLKPEDINQEIIQQNLYLNSEPDLIIRTGGDYRTSNFLPWQSTYSEWFFLEKKWPEFEKQDLIDCVDQFSKRERRFGK